MTAVMKEIPVVYISTARMNVAMYIIIITRMNVVYNLNFV
jgi:hypothetical protein